MVLLVSFLFTNSTYAAATTLRPTLSSNNKMVKGFNNLADNGFNKPLTFQQNLTKQALNQKIVTILNQLEFAAKNELWLFVKPLKEEAEALIEARRDDIDNLKTTTEKVEKYELPKKIPDLSPLGRVLSLKQGQIVFYDGTPLEKIVPLIEGKIKKLDLTDWMKIHAVAGMTTNGVIIEQVIEQYKDKIIKLGKKGNKSIEEIYNEVIVKGLVREVAIALEPAHLSGQPSTVSVEVRSHLDKVIDIVGEAKMLIGLIGKEHAHNVTIKVPGIEAGIESLNGIMQLGIQTNVTCVFSSLEQIRRIANRLGSAFINYYVNRKIEKATDKEIISELQAWKNFISYFFSRVYTSLTAEENIIKAIHNAESEDEKWDLLNLVLDGPVAFYVKAQDEFLKTLRGVENISENIKFTDLEALGLRPTIELDASTGDKPVNADSAFVKAFTDGKNKKANIRIEELAEKLLINEYKDLFKRNGYFIFRAARKGSMDTVPTGSWDKIVADKGDIASFLDAMTLDEATDILYRFKTLFGSEFAFEGDKWETIGQGHVKAGIKGFIKAEQGLRIKIAQILTDADGIDANYLTTEIDNLKNPDIQTTEQLKTLDELRSKLNLSSNHKLSNRAMDQVQVIAAAQIISNGAEWFTNWLTKQGPEDAVVVVAADVKEYNQVKQFDNDVHIKVIDGKGVRSLNLKPEQIIYIGKEARPLLIQELAIYENGIGLNTLNNRLKPAAIKQIGKGV